MCLSDVNDCDPARVLPGLRKCAQHPRTAPIASAPRCFTFGCSWNLHLLPCGSEPEGRIRITIAAVPTRQELHTLVDTLPEGATFVQETLRNHKSHELTIVERIRAEADRLIYKHEVRGPGDKPDEREVTFDLA